MSDSDSDSDDELDDPTYSEFGNKSYSFNMPKTIDFIAAKPHFDHLPNFLADTTIYI